LAIAKGNLQRCAAGALKLSFCQAHRLFLELNRPVVRRVSDRARLFLSADCFQVVVYYLSAKATSWFRFAPALADVGQRKKEGQETKPDRSRVKMFR